MADTPAADPLYVFTGIRSAKVLDALRWVLSRRGDVEGAFVERLTRYPLESLTGFLFATSAAFYLAERGTNPKIKTLVDALYYISTCLSVGYAEIFATTQPGRAIATLVMTLGPSLTGEALDPPFKAAAASQRGQDAMVQKLDEILAELKRANQGAGSGEQDSLVQPETGPQP